ncbi:hypothetical protein [Flammeovirga sp. SJP92]|uniref:hypothetical protein n=1 Tax=Flammeovirga sp. SJP92 TaxID=1775430 RepID=UPI0012FB8F82|nr:hypothetical protein [Flammeovirga sp. SJP92]
MVKSIIEKIKKRFGNDIERYSYSETYKTFTSSNKVSLKGIASIAHLTNIEEDEKIN